MNDDWRKRLADLRAATSRYDEADKHEHRLYRIFKKLSGRMGDVRAYELAGIQLADHRCLRASREMKQARAAFKAIASNAPTYARILAAGIQPLSYLPWAANDRRPLKLERAL